MITQSLYLDLQVMASAFLAERRDVFVDDELKKFIKPYILVIHRPSRRGFYIGGSFRCILSVSDCKDPKSPVKMVRQYLPKGYTCPVWVDRTNVEYQVEEFDTFWLY